ncbi:hypothetical protein IWGMT90018_03880 [Mycobacterium kiyosense]|nr:hypothetical protein IWGMT90018_03880 [Mycobacterium kiyosense]
MAGVIETDPAQFGGVLADLLRSGHAHPGEFERRVGDEFGKGQTADISGAHMGDTNWHEWSLHPAALQFSRH